jgi:hypothetical protein
MSLSKPTCLGAGVSRPTGLPRWVYSTPPPCSSRSVFKKLAKLRAGIESNISALKRAFGLSRVSWKGEDGFMKCVWSAVVAYNLFTLTR